MSTLPRSTTPPTQDPLHVSLNSFRLVTHSKNVNVNNAHVSRKTFHMRDNVLHLALPSGERHVRTFVKIMCGADVRDVIYFPVVFLKSSPTGRQALTSVVLSGVSCEDPTSRHHRPSRRTRYTPKAPAGRTRCHACFLSGWICNAAEEIKQEIMKANM